MYYVLKSFLKFYFFYIHIIQINPCPQRSPCTTLQLYICTRHVCTLVLCEQLYTKTCLKFSRKKLICLTIKKSLASSNATKHFFPVLYVILWWCGAPHWNVDQRLVQKKCCSTIMHLDYHIKNSFMYHVSDLRFKTTFLLQIDCFYGAGSSAVDFTRLGHRKCFGTK